MNDADLDILARQSGGAFDAWLRSQALGHAIAYNPSACTPQSIMRTAQKFYEFSKGSANDGKQDER